MSKEEKFWKYIFLMSKRRFKRAHLNRVHNDIKCPTCKEWFSISGIEHNHKLEVEPDKGYDVCTCGQCEEKSYWSSDIAPFPVLVNKEGFPVSK